MKRYDAREYPAEVYWHVQPDGDAYWFAFLPDFGHSACSATGITELQAVNRLRQVQMDVMSHYLDTGRPLPTPSYYDCNSSEGRLPGPNPALEPARAIWKKAAKKVGLPFSDEGETP